MFRLYSGENKDRFPRTHGDQPFGAETKRQRACDHATFQEFTAFGPDMTEIYPRVPERRAGADVPLSDADFSGDNPLGIVADDGSGTCGYVGLVTHGDQSYNYVGYALDRVDEDDPQVTNPFPGPAQAGGAVECVRADHAGSRAATDAR